MSKEGRDLMAEVISVIGQTQSQLIDLGLNKMDQQDIELGRVLGKVLEYVYPEFKKHVSC